MDELDKHSIGSLINMVASSKKSKRKSTPVATTLTATDTEHSKKANSSLNKIDKAKKEAEYISLVLRLRGDSFPTQEVTDQSQPKPPFVVGLAHHGPSNVFLLFAFPSQTLRCRLARFDCNEKTILPQ